MDDRNLNLSFAGLWKQLSEPVLALAEERALHHATGERPAVELVVRSGGVDAVRLRGAAREAILSVAGRPQAAAQDAVGQLGAALGREVALSFAADQSISQHIVLPQQTDDVLRAIVRNKVESFAPWPLGQCLWAMRASPVAGDPQHVGVDVAVVSRAALDDLAVILRRSGAEVKALSVMLPDGDALDIELGGGEVRHAARERAIRLAKAAAAAAILIAGLELFWIYRTSSETAALDQETTQLMASLKPSGALAGETPLVSAANRIYQARRDRLPFVAVLNEVSRLLPDNVHLVALTLDGDQLNIKGQGSGVPDLIEILEASPTFQGVNFAAATELDQNSNADAFSLIATLEKALPPGAQP